MLIWIWSYTPRASTWTLSVVILWIFSIHVYIFVPINFSKCDPFKIGCRHKKQTIIHSIEDCRNHLVWSFYYFNSFAFTMICHKYIDLHLIASLGKTFLVTLCPRSHLDAQWWHYCLTYDVLLQLICHLLHFLYQNKCLA